MDEAENPDLKVIYVLVEEDFFWEKVDSTLRALTCEPFTPQWDGDILQQLHGVAGKGAVVDLENEGIQALEIVADLRSPDRPGGPLPVLAYASYDREDLLQASERLGALTVARSTFASSLVRLLQDLTRDDEDEASDTTRAGE